jgi:putative ABC transport system permease protein
MGIMPSTAPNFPVQPFSDSRTRLPEKVTLTVVKEKISHSKPALSEVFNLVRDTFRGNKIRFALTAAGIAVGTASLILVVTIGLTGRQYLLRLIQSIGSNEIWAEYESGAQRITSAPFDFLTLGDMRAVQTQVPGIVAATPVVKLGERVPFREGRERDILILGVYSDYWIVRNLVPVSGRFFDRLDDEGHSKACVITLAMAQKLYGSPEAAVGRTIKLSGLPFTVIGTFKERVDTWGQTEVTDDTMVIPYSASRYLSDTENVKMLYFSVAAPSMVFSATSKIRDIIVARHRAESVYRIDNLSQLVGLADRITKTLTLILLSVAGVTLLVGGVGIMNIMLATVGTRVQEVGIRKSVGATAGDIKLQFLSEAIAISVGGGLIGVLVGLGLPFSLRLLTEYRIPVSGFSAIVGIGVSSLVGVLFGTFPAIRAARLNPIDSLRHE